MYEYFVTAEEGMLEIDIGSMDDDCLIHNNNDNPTSEIFCVLTAPNNTDNFTFKYKIQLVGFKTDITILKPHNIKYNKVNFVGFNDVKEHESEKESLAYSSVTTQQTSATEESKYQICSPALEAKLLDITIKTLPEDLILEIKDKILSPAALAKFADMLKQSSDEKLFVINRLQNFIAKQQPEIIPLLDKQVDFSNEILSIEVLTILSMQPSYLISPDNLDKTVFILKHITNNNTHHNLIDYCSIILKHAVSQGMDNLDSSVIETIITKLESNNVPFIEFINVLLGIHFNNIKAGKIIENGHIDFLEKYLPHIQDNIIIYENLLVVFAVLYENQSQGSLLSKQTLDLIINKLPDLIAFIKEDKTTASIDGGIKHSFILLRHMIADHTLDKEQYLLILKTFIDSANSIQHITAKTNYLHIISSNLILTQTDLLTQIIKEDKDSQARQSKSELLNQSLNMIENSLPATENDLYKTTITNIKNHLLEILLDLPKYQFDSQLLDVLYRVLIPENISASKKLQDILEYVLIGRANNNFSAPLIDWAFELLEKYSTNSQVLMGHRLIKEFSINTEHNARIEILEELEKLILNENKITDKSFHILSELLSEEQISNEVLYQLLEVLLLASNTQIIHHKVLYIIDKLISAIPDNQKFIDLSHYIMERNSKHFSITNEADNITEQTRPGKNDEQILSELAQLNSKYKNFDKESIEVLSTQYKNILTAYKEDSTILALGKPIADWQQDDILKFAKHFKNVYMATKPDIEKYQYELLAVIKKANILSSGNDPRSVQMLAILLYLFATDKGTLLQVSTGEGKSTITAILAAFKALQGASIDIVTSSPVLAQRDADDPEKQKFFNMLGLRASHNTGEESRHRPKQCYKANIVYGDASSFQFDLLFDEFQQEGTRCGRKFDIVIVDEVDSMLIDESNKIAMLSTHLPLSEYLQVIYSAIWAKLEHTHKHLVPHADGTVYVDGEFKISEDGRIMLLDNKAGGIYEVEHPAQKLKEIMIYYTKELLMSGKIKLPRHLEEFALSQVDSWVQSALQAKVMSIDKDYVIINQNGVQIIAPVDYLNTGVTSSNTQWSNGLHQFLQLKSGLKLTSENLTTSYISNTGFFKRYGDNVYGMSGTLGSVDEQDLLQSIYNIESYRIPTYKEKQFKELSSTVTSDKNEYYQAIIDSIKDKVDNSRSVLVICNTIAEAKEFYKTTLKLFSSAKVKLYSRTDNDEYLSIQDRVSSGEIIIATNLAGRGTDIKTTKLLDSCGGLHVLVSYLPNNLRIEEQAFGRTSRQGNNGTAELIIYLPDALNTLGYSRHDAINNIELLKELRGEVESQRVLRAKLLDFPRIDIQDKLFDAFCNFYLKMKESNNNPQKLNQLEELWGFVLKDILYFNFQQVPKIAYLPLDEAIAKAEEYNKKIQENSWEIFNKFKDKSSQEYPQDYMIMQNIGHVIQAAINQDDYHEAIRLLNIAITTDEHYNFSAYYNKAYYLIRLDAEASEKKKKVVKSHLGEAFGDLQNSKRVMLNNIIPKLDAIAALNTNIGDNDLQQQIQDKRAILNFYIEAIDKVCKKIQNSSGKKYIDISETTPLKEYFATDKVPAKEITEFNSIGLMNIFDVEEYKPPVKFWSGVAVAILGIVQIGIGVACALSGNMPMANLLVTSGMSDVVKSVGIFNGKPFEWKNYVTEKGIMIAVYVMSLGFDKLTEHFNIPVISPDKLLGITDPVTAVMVNASSVLIGDKIISFAEAKAAKNIEKAFREDIIDAIESKIEAIFDKDSLQKDLAALLALDKFNNDGANIREITKILSGALKERNNAIKSIFDSVLSKISSTTSTSGVGLAIKGANLANKTINIAGTVRDVSKITKEICAKIEAHIHTEAATKSNITNFIETQSQKIDHATALSITEALKKSGVIVNGKLQADKILLPDGSYESVWSLSKAEQPALFALEFPGDIDPQLAKIIKERLAKLYQLQQNNYLDEQNDLKENIIATLQTSMSNKVRSNVITPLMSPITDSMRSYLSKEIQQKYYEITDSKFAERQQAIKDQEAKNKEALDEINKGKTEIAADSNDREEVDDLPWSKDSAPDASAPNTDGSLALAPEVSPNIAPEQMSDPAANDNAPDSTQIPADFDFIAANNAAMQGQESGSTPANDNDSESHPTLIDNLQNIVGAGNHKLTADGGTTMPGAAVVKDSSNNSIWDLFDKYYEQSLDETTRKQHNTASDLLKERNQEIDKNITLIKQGSGSEIFKSIAQMNEETGGAIRYIMDQINLTTHQTAPKLTATIDAVGNVVGQGVGAVMKAITPEPVQDYVKEKAAAAYDRFIEIYPSENQRFMVTLPAGILVAELGVTGLKYAKLNANGVVDQVTHVSPSTLKQVIAETPPIKQNSGKTPATGLSSEGTAKPATLQNKIDVNTGVIKPDLPSKSQEHLAQLKGTSEWPQLEQYLQKVPEGYKLQGYPKGDKTIGLVFKKGEHNEIVFKKAKLDAKYDSQKVDYVSYKIHGNKHMTANGDHLFDSNGVIMKYDATTQKTVPLPREEVKRLGITYAEEHPDVHMPIKEFIKKYGDK